MRQSFPINMIFYSYDPHETNLEGKPGRNKKVSPLQPRGYGFKLSKEPLRFLW